MIAPLPPINSLHPLSSVATRARAIPRPWLITFLVLANTFLAGLWWLFTAPGRDRTISVPALFMLLILGTVSMIILPLIIDGIGRKRWLLIVILGLVNIFWCLRWIDLFAQATPLDHDYPNTRYAVAAMMFVTSLAVIVAYGLVATGLRFLRARPSQTQ